MDDSQTTDLRISQEFSDNSVSGFSIKRILNSMKNRPFGQIKEAYLALHFHSSGTVMADAIFFDRTKLGASTVEFVQVRKIGRSISRSEALKIARSILEDAENRRIKASEWEASRYLQWENE